MFGDALVFSRLLRVLYRHLNTNFAAYYVIMNIHELHKCREEPRSVWELYGDRRVVTLKQYGLFYHKTGQTVHLLCYAETFCQIIH